MKLFVQNTATCISFIVLMSGMMLVVIGFVTMLGLDIVHQGNEVLHQRIDVIQISCLQMIVGALVALIGKLINK